MGWSRYRDANPVPTSPLTDDLATAPSGPVRKHQAKNQDVWAASHQWRLANPGHSGAKPSPIGRSVGGLPLLTIRISDDKDDCDVTATDL